MVHVLYQNFDKSEIQTVAFVVQNGGSDLLVEKNHYLVLWFPDHASAAEATRTNATNANNEVFQRLKIFKLKTQLTPGVYE